MTMDDEEIHQKMENPFIEQRAASVAHPGLNHSLIDHALKAEL